MGIVQPLPDVAEMKGVSLCGQGQPDPQRMQIIVQYSDRTDTWFELKMSYLDAMKLLAYLRQVERDVASIASSKKPPN